MSFSSLPENIFDKVHSISLKKLITSLDSSNQGITERQVSLRLQSVGYNKLTEKKKTPGIIKFILQFNNFFSYLLLFGALLSFLSEYLVPGEGSIYIAWALLGVIILNATFTYLQEAKAEKAMDSFRKLMTFEVVVLRDNEKKKIDSTLLVPGDIILLSEGDKITADARIIEQSDLKVDHSALTGESEPQLRSTKSTSKKLLLSRNMVFSGTLVQSGSGKAIVVATGDNTQIGKIAKETDGVKPQLSHLQTQIAHFIKIISYIAIFLGISFFFIGLFVTGNTFWANLVFAIGIIVANVPEGLLPTVTLTLSIAAQKMAKKNVLVKNIDAIETLGSLTVICSDKTGTLTENNLNTHGFYINNKFYNFDRQKKQIMQRKKVIRASSIKGMREFNDIMLLCNNSTYDPKGGKEFGDSTDICLKKFVSNFVNINYISSHHPRLHEIPFSSETKYMITSNTYDKKKKAYMKGAPEIVLGKCTHYFKDGKYIKLNSKAKREILDQNKHFSEKGFRVLGCALKSLNSSSKSSIDKNDFIFYGLIFMQDPPRPEIHDAVRLCNKAGIKVIVISGDQETTVESIARQTGIVKSKTPSIINCSELSDMSDARLKNILSNDELIFARALPKDKLRIASILKEMGEVIAMTGDGVNDSPALRCADVGVAMGKAGTEVAKEAADVVLLDDNFASIVHAIKSGRTVYDNIKSFITYILTSNTPEIVPFLMFILLGWPLALPVLLILAIDLGTDMIPAIGLGMESSSKDVMTRPPRDPKSKLLNMRMIARSYGFIGPLQTVFSYIVFFNILFQKGWSWGASLSASDPAYMSAISGFFATIIVTQMFNVFACRTTRASVFTKGVFTNKYIWIGILSEAILLFLIVLVPPVQMVFKTMPFPPYYLLWMVGFGAIILFFEELRKMIYRKYGIFGVE